jgi:hypothetical protein
LTAAKGGDEYTKRAHRGTCPQGVCGNPDVINPDLLAFFKTVSA